MLLTADEFKGLSILENEKKFLSYYATRPLPTIKQTEASYVKFNSSFPIDTTGKDFIDFKVLCKTPSFERYDEVFFVFQMNLNYFRMLNNMEKVHIIYEANVDRNRIYKLNGKVHISVTRETSSFLLSICDSHNMKRFYNFCKMFHMISKKVELKGLSASSVAILDTFLRNESINIPSFIYSELGFEYLSRQQNEEETITIDDINHLLKKFRLDKNTLKRIKNLVRTND